MRLDNKLFASTGFVLKPTRVSRSLLYWKTVKIDILFIIRTTVEV